MSTVFASKKPSSFSVILDLIDYLVNEHAKAVDEHRKQLNSLKDEMIEITEAEDEMTEAKDV